MPLTSEARRKRSSTIRELRELGEAVLAVLALALANCASAEVPL